MTSGSRAPLLLDLLRALSKASDEWGVWKNADDGISGRGDLDFSAPAGAWSEIGQIFVDWAGTSGLGPVVACRHLPYSLFLIAIDPGAGDFVQLDVKERTTVRGATVFRAPALVPLFENDSRGFIRLRPGAEGLFKLILNGLGRGGRERPEAMGRERIRELLRGDPEGAEAAAATLGSSGRAALQLAREASEGGWRRAAGLRLESGFLLRALIDLSALPTRRAARRAKTTCPVLVAGIRHGRTIPGSLDTWIGRVSESHPVYR